MISERMQESIYKLHKNIGTDDIKQAPGSLRFQRIAAPGLISESQRSKARATDCFFTFCVGINNMHRGNALVSNTCNMMYESLYGCWS